MNRLFEFDPSPHARDFAERGYVHIRNAVTKDFHRKLAAQVDQLLETRRLEKFAIGNKQQALYEFPADGDYLNELLDTVAAVCGLDRTRLVLSERHIKAYEAELDADPSPHKDRFASEVAVGLSVNVPQGSKLLLYPEDDVRPNPFNSTAELWAALTPDRAPEKILERARPVEICDRPRDAIIFRGNAIWHFRSQRSNATMLYLKLNSYNCDPLGEDPTSRDCRQRTLAMLESNGESLAAAVPMIGRQVDHVQRRYTRHWNESLAVAMAGRSPILIDEDEHAALRSMDGRRTVAEIIENMKGSSRAQALDKLRRLAACGIVDLVEPQ